MHCNTGCRPATKHPPTHQTPGAPPPTLYPIPHTLYHMPYTLCPTPYTLYPLPCTLYPIPYTLYPIPYTLYPIPYTLYPTPASLPQNAHSPPGCRGPHQVSPASRSSLCLPLSSVHGTCKTETARFWRWLSCTRPSKLPTYSLFAWRPASRSCSSCLPVFPLPSEDGTPSEVLKDFHLKAKARKWP